MASPSRIFLFGASGSGVSTLGRAVADGFGLTWIDTDDIYWEPSDPPYRLKREVGARQALLVESLASAGSWVVSGSLCGWGDVIIPSIELAVYVYTPPAVRMARLRARERGRYGGRIEPGGDMWQQSIDFVAWAEQYDEGLGDTRSRRKHEVWMKQLACPLLRVDGARSVEELCGRVAQGCTQTCVDDWQTQV